MQFWKRKYIFYKSKQNVNPERWWKEVILKDHCFIDETFILSFTCYTCNIVFLNSSIKKIENLLWYNINFCIQCQIAYYKHNELCK